MFRILVIIGVAATALLAVACSPGGDTGTAREDGAVRNAEGAGISVTATWLASGEGVEGADLSSFPPNRFIALEIVLDTHSGDLGSIDIAAVTELRQKGRAVQPTKWLDVKDDSHHREGVLVFPRDLGDGPVELVVSLAGEPLSLRWDEAPAGNHAGG